MFLHRLRARTFFFEVQCPPNEVRCVLADSRLFANIMRLFSGLVVLPNLSKQMRAEE